MDKKNTPLGLRLAVVAFGVGAFWTAAPAARADDGSFVMIHAFREAQQTQFTSQAILWAAVSGANRKDVLNICDSSEKALTALGIPTLQDFRAKKNHDPDTAACLEKIAKLQEAALAELRVARKIAAADQKGKDDFVLFVNLDKRCNELIGQVGLMINAMAAREAGQAGGSRDSALPEAGPRPAGSPPQVAGKRQARDLPVGWADFTQLTGPEGPSAKYRYDKRGQLYRAEAYYRGNLVVAITEVEDGFRITVANELAVADFASRPWFTRAERDGLIDAYSEYITQTPGGKDNKVVGRFSVRLEQDPSLPVHPSFLLRAAE